MHDAAEIAGATEVSRRAREPHSIGGSATSALCPALPFPLLVSRFTRTRPPRAPPHSPQPHPTPHPPTPAPALSTICNGAWPALGRWLASRELAPLCGRVVCHGLTRTVRLAPLEIQISEGLYLGGWSDARPRVADSTLGEGRFKFFLGVTEWAAGQLEEEVRVRPSRRHGPARAPSARWHGLERGAGRGRASLSAQQAGRAGCGERGAGGGVWGCAAIACHLVPPLVTRSLFHRRRSQVKAGAWLILECDPQMVIKDRVADWRPGQLKPVWTEFMDCLTDEADARRILEQIYPEGE